jgi:periplasmic protein TonB
MIKINTIYFMMAYLLLFIGAANAQQPAAINPDSIYKFVDVPPLYPGGQDSLVAFISRNIKYPEKARKESTVGEVIVQFVVDEKGNVIDPKILKALSPECDAEVIRVLNKMPSWHPGKIKGKKVKSLFTLPVRFSLG